MPTETMNDTDTLPQDAAVHCIKEAKGSGFNHYIELLERHLSYYLEAVIKRRIPCTAVIDWVHYTLYGELPPRRNATQKEADAFRLRYDDDFDLRMVGLYASGLHIENVTQDDLEHIIRHAYSANDWNGVPKGAS
jgi:hypothetical protein